MHSHMATAGDNTTGFISDTLPLNRSFDDDHPEDDPDSTLSCGCFQGFCIRIRPRRRRSSLSSSDLPRPLEEGVLKNAGPGSRSPPCGQKWKLIVRKFRSSGTGRKRAAANFQYDARSYALNFDDGIGREEDGSAYFSFSDRYGAPPPLKKKMNAGSTFGS